MARSVDELSIDEIRQRYLDKGELVSARVLNRLQRDSRQGVRQLYVALKKRYERQRDERLRLQAMRSADIVGVHARNVVAARGRDAGVQRRRKSFARAAERADAVIAARKSLGDGRARVGRSVIDHDQLE